MLKACSDDIDSVSSPRARRDGITKRESTSLHAVNVSGPWNAKPGSEF
jgi:hypothetical protein